VSAGADIYTPPAFVDGIAALPLLLVGDPEKVDRKAQLDRVGAALESLAHEVSTQRDEVTALRKAAADLLAAFEYEGAAADIGDAWPLFETLRGLVKP
jgi:hypothetical protein